MIWWSFSGSNGFLLKSILFNVETFDVHDTELLDINQKRDSFSLGYVCFV